MWRIYFSSIRSLSVLRILLLLKTCIINWLCDALWWLCSRQCYTQIMLKREISFNGIMIYAFRPIEKFVLCVCVQAEALHSICFMFTFLFIFFTSLYSISFGLGWWHLFLAASIMPNTYGSSPSSLCQSIFVTVRDVFHLWFPCEKVNKKKHNQNMANRPFHLLNVRMSESLTFASVCLVVGYSSRKCLLNIKNFEHEISTHNTTFIAITTISIDQLFIMIN